MIPFETLEQLRKVLDEYKFCQTVNAVIEPFKIEREQQPQREEAST